MYYTYIIIMFMHTYILYITNAHSHTRLVRHGAPGNYANCGANAVKFSEIICTAALRCELKHPVVIRVVWSWPHCVVVCVQFVLNTNPPFPSTSTARTNIRTHLISINGDQGIKHTASEKASEGEQFSLENSEITIHSRHQPYNTYMRS